MNASNNNPEICFADRMQAIPPSFIREILKVTAQPNVISFAGGLPNPRFFPAEAIKDAATKVLVIDGNNALQYAVSEGYLPLRQYISQRYLSQGLTISPEEILITNGSQQGIDLAGKILLNKGDCIILESPSYLGAIQAFSAYQPEIVSVDLMPDGIDTSALEQTLASHKVKLMYAIPNFQNPSGTRYSWEKRIRIAELLASSNTILVEDDPYGAIDFTDKPLPSIQKFLPQQTILLGSFSKIVAPGMRLGWVAAPKYIMEKLIIAKQACDLHSNFLSQRIIHQFLVDNDLESHIKQIKNTYLSQRNIMIRAIAQHFPNNISYTIPEGGMFLWITLPHICNTHHLLAAASNAKVAYVPGSTFFLEGKGQNTLRLNFSNTEEIDIQEGIIRLGNILTAYMKELGA